MAINYSKQPTAPSYASPLNQSSWSLPSNLTLNNAGSWKTNALAEQALQQQGSLQDARQQAASGAAQTMSNLAMRGGLSSGARERVAGNAQGNLMNANTQVGLAGAQARAGINTQAGQLSSQEQTQNISNILQQNQYANQLQQQKYATQMSGWAAEQMANAQRVAATADTGKK